MKFSVADAVFAFLAFSCSTLVEAAELDKAFTPIPKLLIISYDAFRHDYFNRTNVVPYLNKLRISGTYADYMKNVFVTKTFPNHHTISTGFYAETHGVIDADFYDGKSNNSHHIDRELYHYNDSIIPIWTANEIGGPGRRTGSMMWPGSAFDYKGQNITRVVPFNHTVPLKDRIDTLLSWFKHKTEPINLGLLYIEEPDYHGHGIGIEGPRFDEILQKVDSITRYLHEQLKEKGLEDVNVIHLSDHGMTSVTRKDIVNLTFYINSDDYKQSGSSPVISIFPNKGKEELIYKQLSLAATETKRFKVYRKSEIPSRYHFSANPRIGPILVEAKIGYAFETLAKSFDWYEKEFNITITDTSRFGVHGYDNEESQMHPFFFANGPAFVKECKLEPFNNIDLYPLFCDLLAIECLEVNGTFNGFKDCLSSYQHEAVMYKAIYIGGIVVSILGIIILYMVHRRSKQRKNNLPYSFRR